MHLKSAFQCAGFYTFHSNKRGKLAEFSNLITDLGLNRLGTSGSYMSYCYVGSGNTPPTVADTQMGNQLAFTSSIQSTTRGQATEAPYYTWTIRRYRFATGVAAGNLTEVGVGFGTSSANNLFSRSLIKDANGDPTTITILADEILDVTYELRLYINTADSSGQLVFTGNRGGTYDWVMRASNITSASWDLSEYKMLHTSGSPQAHSGSIGTITQSPAGIGSGGSFTELAYVNNSLEGKVRLNWSVTQGNLAGGIKSVSFSFGPGRYQIEFTPAIPKTSLETLVLEVGHSWGRKP